MADESGLIRNRRYIVWDTEKASLNKLLLLLTVKLPVSTMIILRLIQTLTWSLHSHYRVSSQCFCSGSSRWYLVSAQPLTLLTSAYLPSLKIKSHELVQLGQVLLTAGTKGKLTGGVGCLRTQYSCDNKKFLPLKMHKICPEFPSLSLFNCSNL
jgi:hypothetical protein